MFIDDLIKSIKIRSSKNQLMWQFPFGKHQGKTLNHATEDYIFWFFNETEVPRPKRLMDLEWVLRAEKRVRTKVEYLEYRKTSIGYMREEHWGEDFDEGMLFDRGWIGQDFL